MSYVRLSASVTEKFSLIGEAAMHWSWLD